MKKLRALALMMAVVLAVPTTPITAVKAANSEGTMIDNSDVVYENAEEESNKLSYEGYNVENPVFFDEFEGTTLDRSKWNVELHEKGWVNNELQEYVDNEKVISVSEGRLNINAVVEKGKRSTPLLNANFASGLDGWTAFVANWGEPDGAADATTTVDAIGKSVKFDIKNTGNEDWNVQLNQENVGLVAGTKYRIAFDIKSTRNRKIKSGLLDDGASVDNWFGGSDITLSANQLQHIEYDVVVTRDTKKGKFYISLGTQSKNQSNDDYEATITDEHSINISNIEMFKLGDQMLSGADFSSGVSGKWSETIANWGPDYETDATRSTNPADKSITYTIDNTGTDEWHVQLKYNDINLEKGKTYRFSCIVNSSMDRKMKSLVMSDPDEYATYGGGAETILKANEDTPLIYEFTMEKDDALADLVFSLGKIGEKITTTHTVTLSDMQLICVDEPYGDTYTSGRISTQNLETFTYGLFEVSAKVPEGAGYLPAFWLMSNDENVYGQWPRCGEIDCMEVMGQETDKLYGTIHYGNPHKENQGTVKGNADYSKGFHKFSCEWLPGEIIWYVDDVEYYRTKDWYSTTEGQGTLTYPAPFDSPFYIILNLAVGGSWVGDINEDTSFDNNPYLVDYVRVYQKDSYDEDVEAPEKAPVDVRTPDAEGNYIVNGKFSSEDLVEDEYWQFKTALSGEATATINNNTMKIETSNAGTVDYSVQLVQAGIPLEKGATYRISFDAWADSARTLKVDMKGPDNGYEPYMSSSINNLTTVRKTYDIDFKMNNNTDYNGRLEYNMGATDSTATIYLQNVSVKKIKEPDEVYDPNKKVVLADGNYIYNGEFDKGPKHLGDWDIEGDGKYIVTPLDDNRKFKATLTDGQELILKQTDLTFESGKDYVFSMYADSDVNALINVSVGGKDYIISVKPGTTDYSFEIPNTVELNSKDVVITLTGAATISIDNVKLAETAIVKNGDFESGNTGYYLYTDKAASASYEVKDGHAEVTVSNIGTAEHHIQLQYGNVPMIKGHEYEIKFDAKSTLDRRIRVTTQKSSGDYAAYVEPESYSYFDITNDWNTYSVTFTMNHDTDMNSNLNFYFATIKDCEIANDHVVSIDNVVILDKTPKAATTDVTVTFDANDGNIVNRVASKTVSENTVIGELPVATKDEYSFAGWYTAKNAGAKVTEETVVLGDMTLYARYGYKLTIDNNDGNAAETIVIPVGETTTELKAPVNGSYNFLGWYTEKVGGTKYEFGKELTKDTAIYAHWGYTVTLDVNGGKLAEGTSTTINKLAGEAVGELPVPVKDRFTFDGWFTDATAGTEVKADTKLTADTKLYAHFTESTFKVTFDANGGKLEEAKATKDVNNGEKYGELPVPTRNDQAFLGWFTDKEEGEEVTADTVVDIIKDQTLYAHWGDIALAVKQKYDVSKCFEGIEGIQGYKVKNIDGKATITKNGMLTAKKAGLVSVLPCEKVNGKLKEMDVDPVYFDISAPKFDGKLKATYVKEVINPLDYIVGIPTNSNVVKVTLANEKFATLSENGIDIIASKSGKVKVTVIIENTQGSQVKLNTTLTVKIPKLSCKEKFSLRKNKTKTLSVKNIERTDSVIWESSDPEIVTVTQTKNKAKIKAVGQGTAIITCTVNDHPYSTTVTVP